MATSLSGGGSRSTRREPPTMGMQLVNLLNHQGPQLHMWWLFLCWYLYFSNWQCIAHIQRLFEVKGVCVRFVYISELVDYHCLSCLFIIYNEEQLNIYLHQCNPQYTFDKLWMMGIFWVCITILIFLMQINERFISKVQILSLNTTKILYAQFISLT